MASDNLFILPTFNKENGIDVSSIPYRKNMIYLIILILIMLLNIFFFVYNKYENLYKSNRYYNCYTD